MNCFVSHDGVLAYTSSHKWANSCRCLGLLMELEEPRTQLLASGVLARLLPYVELALRDDIEALKEV